MVSEHLIISIERGTTKNSGSPLWRCRTVDGVRVNVFQHADRDKDTYHFFFDVSAERLLDGMTQGDVRTFTAAPIPVTLQKSGEWYALIAVDPSAVKLMPDTPYLPDLAAARAQAVKWARDIQALHGQAVIVDCETTGLTPADEIISLALITLDGGVLFDEFIQPVQLDRVAQTTHIHGITVEQLVDAQPIAHYLPLLSALLDEALLLGWNIEFDFDMLDRAFMRAGAQALPLPLLSTDVAEVFARWYGEFDAGRQAFMLHKLGSAVATFGGDVAFLHRALDDCQGVRAVVAGMAASQ